MVVWRIGWWFGNISLSDRPGDERVRLSELNARQLLGKEGKKQTETNRWRADGRIITHRCFPEAAASVPRLNQQLDLWDGTGPPPLAALTSNKKPRLSLKEEEEEEGERRGAHQPSTRALIASI